MRIETFELALPVRQGVPAHDRVLRGRLRVPDVALPAPWMLLVPGYLASMDWAFVPWLERSLNDVGLATLALTLSGSGFAQDPTTVTERIAFEHNTYAQEIEDVGVAADWAATRPELDQGRACIWGHSRGSAMALVHAAERGGYRAWCGWASVGRVGRYDPHRIVEWREKGRLPVATADGQRFHLAQDLLHDFTAGAARYDLVVAAKRFRGRALFVHGARDRSVSVEEARACLPRFEGRAELVEVPATGHNFGARHPVDEPRPPLRTALEATAAFCSNTFRVPG